MTLLATSCSGEKKDVTVETKETRSEVNENKYVDMIPTTEDFFKNGKVTVINDGKTQYSFRIEKCQEGEYESYVEECKNIGFDNVTYEHESDGGKVIYLNSSDEKYYIHVTLYYDKDAVDVYCGENTEE